jgi:hypothetical protein
VWQVKVEEPTDSFFQFFDPPEPPEEEMDEEDMEQLQAALPISRPHLPSRGGRGVAAGSSAHISPTSPQ